MSEPNGTRTRRSSADVRELILTAARDLFSAEGFETTTTKAIATRAGVAEPLIFSNFGSKAALFDEAVLAPITSFVTDYADSWRDRTAEESPAVRTEMFVSGLFDLARRNREMLLTALQRTERTPADSLDQLARTLQGLRGVSDLEQFTDVDAPAALAAAVGMVLGVALLDELLFPLGARRPGNGRLLAEMEKLLVYGITRRER